MALSAKQRKLFDCLRQLEEERARLPRAELLARLVRDTGYKEVSTYLSKYLAPVMVKSAHPDGDRLEVRGVLAMAEDSFARMLTQKRVEGETSTMQYAGAAEWADAMRALARYGANRGYRLAREDGRLFQGILTSPPGR